MFDNPAVNAILVIAIILAVVFAVRKFKSGNGGGDGSQGNTKLK